MDQEDGVRLEASPQALPDRRPNQNSGVVPGERVAGRKHAI